MISQRPGVSHLAKFIRLLWMRLVNEYSAIADANSWTPVGQQIEIFGAAEMLVQQRGSGGSGRGGKELWVAVMNEPPDSLHEPGQRPGKRQRRAHQAGAQGGVEAFQMVGWQPPCGR
jgi:hypothetical protein